MCIKKIIASFTAAVCLCTCLAASVSAEPINGRALVSGVSPLYDVAEVAYSRLNIVGTKAECQSEAKGKDVVKIVVEQTLQKYSGWFWAWDDVSGAAWTKTVNDSSISLSNTKSGLSSGTYRVKSVFTLTDISGKTETVTVYSGEKKIG
ncbi:MAG: hypothetical protein NC203_01705 [Firmicutes bacterium]|nr:hypothetical protein [[Eubacterium] siraeum]MCM1487057.1 hypothetical protein [Bacillota bacterium]